LEEAVDLSASLLCLVARGARFFDGGLQPVGSRHLRAGDGFGFDVFLEDLLADLPFAEVVRSELLAFVGSVGSDDAAASIVFGRGLGSGAGGHNSSYMSTIIGRF